MSAGGPGSSRAEKVHAIDPERSHSAICGIYEPRYSNRSVQMRAPVDCARCVKALKKKEDKS